jgi:hypothetical protein
MKKVIYHILTFLMKREKLVHLLSTKEERELLKFKNEGYLYDIGWTNSIITGNIVDQLNKPLPWVTYPFIQFIDNKLNKEFEIFEFGSGNSTLYYAGKTCLVNSVEHDRFWYDKIKSSMPPNVSLFYCELEKGGDYCWYAAKTGKGYDIIVVDGRDRVNCCVNSIAALKANGVLILDDSEREKYTAGVNFLTAKGFKKIDFWGTAPTVNYLKCTSLFYRENNCLGI